MERRRAGYCRALSFLLPCCLLLLLYALNGLAPFGVQTLAAADAKNQYLSYFQFYRELLLGRQDPFYSFEKVLGGSVSGLFAYYLASPFNLLLLPFSPPQLPLALDLLILLKLSCCGLTMGAFLARRGGWTLGGLLLSTAYALCGYVNAFSWSIMWLDALLLLPLIAWGLHRLCEEGKPFLYLFSLAAAILSCFYIGYMLCLFSLLYFLWLLAAGAKGARQSTPRTLGRFAAASLLAGALGAVLWLPGVLSLRGGLEGSALDRLRAYSYPACLWILQRLLPGRELARYNTLILPTLLAAAALLGALLALAVWLLFSRRTKPALRWTAWLLPAGLLLAWRLTGERHVLAELAQAEHYALPKLLFGITDLQESYGGSANLYVGQATALLALGYFANRRIPARERAASLLLLGVLLGSCLFYLPNLLWHGGELNDCFNYRWSFVLSFFLCSLAHRALEERDGLQGGALALGAGAALLIGLETLWLRPAFAARWQLLAALLFVPLCLLLIARLRTASGRAALRLLVVLQLAELCLSFGLSIRAQSGFAVKTDEYRQKYAYGAERLAAIDAADGDFFRIRKERTILSSNDPLLFSYPGVVHFSSAERRENTRFMAALGLSVLEGSWANGEAGMTQAADSLLGVRYYLGTETPAAYLREAETLQRNPYALPLLHTVPAAALEELHYGEDPFDNLERIYAALGGQRPLYRTLDCGGSLEDAGQTALYRIRVEAEQPLYVYLPLNTADSCTLFAGETQLRRFAYVPSPQILYLGVFAPGEELLLRVRAQEGLRLDGRALRLAYESAEALADCHARLTVGACQIRMERQSRILCSVTLDEPGWLMASFPLEAGWQLRVDGQAAPLEKALGFFPAAALSAGTHELELRFVPPGLAAGAALSACALILALAWLAIARRRASRRSPRLTSLPKRATV